MIVISKHMIKAWCKVEGQPGYLLTTGAKVKQTSVKFEQIICQECKKDVTILEEPKRMEAYVRRFAMCIECHAKKLFPDNEDKQNSFYLTMACKKSIGAYGETYQVDLMLRSCIRNVK